MSYQDRYGGYAVSSERDPLGCEDIPECQEPAQEPSEESFEPSVEPPEQADPDDCDEPLGFRKVLPNGEGTAPSNSRVFVSLIGNGDDSHATVSLRDESNQFVEGEVTSECYIHEGDAEFHCNYLFVPTESLQADHQYTVTISGTEFHHDPAWNYESRFETGSRISSLGETAPLLEIIGYMEREPGALDPCDWYGAYKYELRMTLAESLSNDLSMIHVYEVDGNTESIVHTIFVPPGAETSEFRQVMKPGEEGPRCYRAVHEDIAGNQSDSSEILCWESK
jgi:hypothetical protein